MWRLCGSRRGTIEEGAAMKKLLVVTAMICAIGAGTAGVVAADTAAERIPVGCDVAYFPDLGTWGGAIFTSDTPPFLPIAPDGPGPFAFGSGTGVFTPSGNMEVNCKGEANLLISPPFTGHGSCFAARGGDDFGHRSRSYAGEGELVVTANGNVSISCHGAFVGIVP